MFLVWLFSDASIFLGFALIVLPGFILPEVFSPCFFARVCFRLLCLRFHKALKDGDRRRTLRPGDDIIVFFISFCSNVKQVTNYCCLIQRTRLNKSET